MIKGKKIAVVVPCFCVRNSILQVIKNIPDFVDSIICVDDKCPEDSGKFIQNSISDPKITVLFNEENKGVGGAVIQGFSHILNHKSADIIAKIDGDGQMNPKLLKSFIQPIIEDQCDYCKGNRFSSLNDIIEMPPVRLIGNFALGFINKISSGYWNVFDPTNGYTVISANLLSKLNLKSISCRYFFESDMLFHLHLIDARVFDIPMKALYGSEKSHLHAFEAIVTFGFHHTVNFFKRIFLCIKKQPLSLQSLAIIYCFKGIISALFIILIKGYSYQTYEDLISTLTFLLLFFFFDIKNNMKINKGTLNK